MSPITKSAKKSLRQNKRRRINNLQRKRKIKDLFKEVDLSLSEGKRKEVEKLVPELYKALDKAVKTNAIKKQTAARKKSRLMKRLKSGN